MLTINIDIGDRLLNGSLGTVMYMNNGATNRVAEGIIYVKFEDENAGNSYKDNRLRGVFKQCMPISVSTNRSSFKRSKSLIVAERKQFPLVLAHAVTIHKFQGSTIDYMTGNLDLASRNKNRSDPVFDGMLYTMLSWAKSRDQLKDLNIFENQIKVNNDAVVEMERMKEKCVLDCTHPLVQMCNSMNTCLFNITSWNLYLQHFLADQFHASNSSVFGFTETGITSQNHSYADISEYLPTWKNIHKPTEHGLAICNNRTRVTIESIANVTSDFEILSVVMEIESKFVLLVVVYRPPLFNQNIFIYQLQMQLITFQQVSIEQLS